MFQFYDVEYDPNVNSGRNLGECIRLNKLQRKEVKKGNRPTHIKYWPKNDDELVYIPYKIEKFDLIPQFGFSSKQTGYIKAALSEFEKYTNIR